MALRHEHEAGNIDSLAFVVMPDHLHWLFALSVDKKVSECVRNVKCQSARLINKRLRRKGTIWQKGFYDRAIRRDDDVVRVARYIIADLWRAGIVDSATSLYAMWE